MPSIQHLTRQQHAKLESEKKFRMKKKLLSLGYTMGWDTARNADERGLQRWQICKIHIDQFMLSHGVVKEFMDNMTSTQLAQAITQLTQVTNAFLKKI